MIFNNKILVALALSSTMMVSTVEAKNLFKGAGRARGDVAAAETRFLKGKGGGEGNGACNPKPPTCDGASGKGGKRGGKAGKNSCSGKGKNGGEPTSTVTCGDEFTGSVTLLQPLTCFDSVFNAITMDGPEAVLDCGGFKIDGNGNSDSEYGIYLKNGATAINCYVTGFDSAGIDVGNGGTILDSTVIGNEEGITAFGEGCVTVEDVSVVGNDFEGIELDLDDDADVYLTNVYVVGNGFFGEGGYHGLLANCAGTITVVDSIFSGNSEDGVRLEDCPTQLTFYGQNDVSNNGDDGITIDDDSNADIFVNGFLSVVSNADNGLRLEDGKFTFNECSSGLICDNNDNIDERDGADLVEEDGNNVKSCSDFEDGEARACISEDE